MLDVIAFDPSLPWGPAGESGTSRPASRPEINAMQADYELVPMDDPAADPHAPQKVRNIHTGEIFDTATFATGEAASHGRQWLQTHITTGPHAGLPIGEPFRSHRSVGDVLAFPVKLVASVAANIVTAPFTKEFWSWPGLIGFGLGLALPFVKWSPWFSVGLGTGIAIGGYYSEEGSWFRRFSIGAGIGAGVGGAFYAYQNWPGWGEFGESLAKALNYLTFNPLNPGRSSIYVDLMTNTISKAVYFGVGVGVGALPALWSNLTTYDDPTV